MSDQPLVLDEAVENRPTGMRPFDWPDDMPVHEAIGQAIGAASVCWENLGGAGVFQSTWAAQVADELEGFIRRKLLGDLR